MSPASLVAANQSTKGILQPGFMFNGGGEAVEVLEDSTFDSVAKEFTEKGVPYDAVMAAVGNEDLGGMFRDGAELNVNRYIVRPGETLETNGTGWETPILISDNLKTVDLFAAGTPILVDLEKLAQVSGKTLGQIAQISGVDAEDILRQNSGAPISEDNAIQLPGLASIPDDPAKDFCMPLAIPANTSLLRIVENVLGLEEWPNLNELVTRNALMPNTLRGGQKVSIMTRHDFYYITVSYDTYDGDSFQSLADRAGVSISDLALSIKDNDQVLNEGSVLLITAAQLPPGEPYPSLMPVYVLSPRIAAKHFQLSPTALFSANAATPDMIAFGQRIRATRQKGAPSLLTKSGDSLNAIVSRFAEMGQATTVVEVIVANVDDYFLRPGARILLPPSTMTADVPLNVTLQGALFPLRTILSLHRDRRLVDPAFRGTADKPSNVEQVSTALVARKTVTTSNTGGAASLEEFAIHLEEAVPNVRLATGKSPTASDATDPADLWLMAFTESICISSLTIAPTETVPGLTNRQPRVFALRPLSNTLESRNRVSIRPFDPASGLGDAEERDYQGIDLEVWARSVVSDVDLFLSAAYASPCYRLAPDDLTRVLDAKAKLADAIPKGLALVLDLELEESEGREAINLAAARGEVTSELLTKLSRAYDVDAVIQYDADVYSGSSADIARLVGAARVSSISDPNGGVQDNPAELAADQVQITSAKTALTNGVSPVSFLMFVPNDAAQKSVTFALGYPINEIEYDLKSVGGYVASNWLTLLRPLTERPPEEVTIDLGEPTVPLPLRSYPSTIALVGQEVVTNSDPETVQDSVYWTYVTQYQHTAAAQDQVWIEIMLNQPPATTEAAANAPDLFDGLAQYAAVSQSLWSILPELTKEVSDPPPTSLTNAIEVFADLTEEIAESWDGYWSDRPSDFLFEPSKGVEEEPNVPTQIWKFTAELESQISASGQPMVGLLRLRRRTGSDDVIWPDISVIDENGQEMALARATPDDQNARVYAFPTPVEPLSTLRFKFSFRDLHIATYQNVSSRIAVVRNAELLGPDGPVTNPDFVYHTPVLEFPETLVPIISSNKPIDIGPWGQSSLTNLFDVIFDGNINDRKVLIATRYGFALSDQPGSLETFIPATLFPKRLYPKGEDIISGMISAMDTWLGNEDPTPQGAVWQLSISVFSAFDYELDRPVLELKQLYSGIDA